jgi:integrase
MLRLAAATGLRQKEVATLRTEDVDHLAAMIYAPAETKTRRVSVSLTRCLFE